MSAPSILEFFAAWHQRNPSQAGLGATIVYGWMPTSLRWNQQISELSFFEAIREPSVQKQAFGRVVELLLGSVIGASKLCHFINPHVYPIWDMRVSSALGNGHSYYSVNKFSRYREYQGLLIEIAESPVGETAVRKVFEPTGQHVTPLRALEMIIFYSQPAIQT